MIDYNSNVYAKMKVGNDEIFDFTVSDDSNLDEKTVQSFGEEWSKFDDFSAQELNVTGAEYFDVLPVDFPLNAIVLDVGCGTGRWSKYLAEKVEFIEAIDPSDAVLSAYKLLKNNKNVRITKASVETIPFKDETFDLVFSLGVLHHIPNTFDAMKKCVEKVKPGGYFLVYLYYSLDNRGVFYKFLFQCSNLVRLVISKLPTKLKQFTCNLIAVFVYYPFISISRFLFAIGLKKLANKIPLAYYRNKSWNIVKNDSLDRFGTPLEQRFSKIEIEKMMLDSGLTDIVFSPKNPYWHAIGRKA